MFAIGVQLPSRCFVLHRTIVMLKLGIAFLPWLVFAAVLIEALDSKPCSICTGLTGLGIERRGKRVFFSEHRTIHLKVIVCGVFIHPFAQALVSDELNDANRFINGSILLFVARKFVLVDQHTLASSSFLAVASYILEVSR